MSQVAIPFAFESYLQDRLLNGLAPDMNEVIFAYLPDLDPEQVIDRNLGLPAPTYWVYRQDVTQKAKLNDDSVAYSVVIPSEVETFTFNAIYLHDKQTADSCGLVVHKTAETKEPGMSSVRTCVQQYTGAARAAKINVTPESWQIDYHARLYGMDDDLRLACFDLFGAASFFADGFLVTQSGSDYLCQQGIGYVAGLRCVNQQQVQLPDAQAGSKIYLDVSWQGQVVSRWATRWTLVVSATSITDYTEDGIQHYVAPIAQIEADGRVTDLRHLGLDENKLPDATITTKGAVIRATDIDVLNGRGSDILSAEQLKAAMSQFGLFGSAYNLGDVVEHSAFDSAPHGLIAFTSRLPLNNDINVAWQGVKSTYGPAYTIIAASNNAGDPKLVFYHSTRNQWSELQQVDSSASLCPIGVPQPWPTDTAPAGWAIMKGQAFDTKAYPVLAALYTDGVLPDMRGLAIVGKKDEESVLSYEADQVKNHGHPDSSVTSTDLGGRNTNGGGDHEHYLFRSGNSAPQTGASNLSSGNYAASGTGPSKIYEGYNIMATGNVSNVGRSSRSPQHIHSMSIGSHAHSVAITAFGATQNTIKNRKFNWIVRLA
ncbi:tail fiber protein [Vibrio rhizosphaerae]|uniref:tail fiber protein n=1 Tax=Vibrio rhizosphaerae TaxID=398736 RepID=UPI00068A9D38|nr:tail fiber protein [Vibrio rhizosphaerae]